MGKVGPKLSWGTLQIWRAGVILGITAHLFLSRNYVTRTEFREFKDTSARMETLTMQRVDQRADGVDRRLDRIENILLSNRGQAKLPEMKAGKVSNE